jgi:tetratricopeptide repeat protein 8
LDQQAWFIKVRATTLKNWVDDTELEEEGVTTVRTDPRNILHVLANNQ